MYKLAPEIQIGDQIHLTTGAHTVADIDLGRDRGSGLRSFTFYDAKGEEIIVVDEYENVKVTSQSRPRCQAPRSR